MTRIIAGVAGSLRLDVPRSGTRPTSDRVREAIFSTLTSWSLIEGARVLDLYAGSGALGLEAASRGARSVTLVEKHAPAARVAAKNAKTVLGAFGGLGSGERSGGYRAPEITPEITVERQTVQTFLDSIDLGSAAPGSTSLDSAGLGSTGLNSADRGPGWDVVMLDPPYDLGEGSLAANLETLVPLLSPEAAVLVERSARSPEPDWPAGLVPLREKRYGETMLWWAEPG